MPLLDHFHPPVENVCPWDTFHSGWATRLADLLNERWLSDEYVAHEHTHAGGAPEIDIATFEQPGGTSAAPRNGPPAVAVSPLPWSPPTAARTFPAIFPESFEIRVFHTMGGRKLVGAIELVSPGNKDRPAERRAFAIKCASYLHAGVSVVVLDVVTSRRANLHNETMQLMDVAADVLLPAEVGLYAVSYRPVLRNERAQIDLWAEPCVLGQPLPTMPLRLTGDLFVPVEFEEPYQETCRRRRVTG